jgi:energy-coupling factor transporter ATP-binding protein EcfA2
MIRQIHIQNYKALRDVTLDLTPFHVLIGPNDSGKTSILEAIRAICGSIVLPPHEWFGSPWRGRELVWNGSGEAIANFEATMVDGSIEATYLLKCEFDRVLRSLIPKFAFFDGKRNSNSGFVQLNDFMGVRAYIAKSESSAFKIASIDGYKPLIEKLFNAMSGVWYCRFNPRRLAMPVGRDLQRRFQLEPSGFGLPILLEDILRTDFNGYTALLNRFRHVFPQIKEIKFEPVEAPTFDPGGAQSQDAKMTLGTELRFEFSNSPATIPASQVSDGILLVLAYLSILNLPDPPRVLLIEEPETGVYPRLLHDVLKILRDLIAKQSRTQVVMTTHSPDLLDMFGPEEVSLCKKESDGSVSVHRLSNSKAVKEQLDIFSLGEIWTGETEEVLIAPAEEPAK